MNLTTLFAIIVLVGCGVIIAKHYIASNKPPEWVESVCIVTRLGVPTFFMYRPVQIFIITAIVGLFVLI